MKIFVTGGTGFIGTSLIKRLAGQGHEVIAMARRPEKLPSTNHSHIHPIPGDLADPVLLSRSMEGCRQVYHLAALAKSWARNPGEFDQTNIEGTRNVMEAGRKAGVERVVHTSTVMVMGPTDGFIANESTPIPRDHLSHYQRTKAVAEDLVSQYNQKGLKIVTVSPSLVYGPGLGNRRVSFNRFLHDFLTGKPVVIPGHGTQSFNCVYLEDVVTGHLLAMERGQPGERYILGGENISLRDLLQLVNKMTGLNKKIFHVPFGVAKTLGLIDEARARLFGGTPLLTWNSVETYRHSWAYSSEKAIRELGYTPRPLQEGLNLTLRWLQNS